MKSNNFMVVQTLTPSVSIIGTYSNHRKPYSHHSFAEELGRIGGGGINNLHGLKLPRSSSTNGVKANDLFKCMKSFLIFGRLVGVVPIAGVFTGNLAQLSFRKCSISGFISLTIITILSCNTGMAIAGFFRTGGRDATALAKNLAASVCYGMGLYVFIFMYRNAGNFVTLLHKWRNLEIDEDYEGQDNRLSFSVNLMAGAILTSAITENAVSHLLLFPLHEHVENPLEYYYENSHKPWALMIPYHAVMAIGVFLCNKWAVYAWNFGDIFIIIVSRAFYGRFKGFVKIASQKLTLQNAGKANWQNAVKDHDKLCKLTEEFADMLSPLVFTSFVVNIYFICIQLHIFLAPSKKQDFIAALYGSWSFLHLLARTFAVTLSAAKINDYANKFGQLLKDCPTNSYSSEVDRAERKLSTYPTALHGLGAFYITRPFTLSVISVIFTFEIVLLQTTMATPTPPSPELK